MEQQEQNKVYWVAGNTQPLLIPLEQEVIGVDNEIVAEPYYPAEGSTVTVNLVGKYNKRSYTPQIDGNLLLITDNGTIGAGAYDVEVLVENPDGTRHRSLWTNQVVVTKQNDSVLQEWDEFKLLDVKARAALFFFAKGDKFAYEDFTEAEIRELQRPAQEKADEVQALVDEWAIAENERVEAENGRVESEDERNVSETERNSAENTRNTNEGTRQGNEATRNSSESSRQLNESARQSSEAERRLAEQQRATTFATYESAINGMQQQIDELQVTNEQFNEIFT